MVVIVHCCVLAVLHFHSTLSFKMIVCSVFRQFLNFFLNFPVGSAKAGSDQLSWWDDSGERWDADTGVRS